MLRVRGDALGFEPRAHFQSTAWPAWIRESTVLADSKNQFVVKGGIYTPRTKLESAGRLSEAIVQRQGQGAVADFENVQWVLDAKSATFAGLEAAYAGEGVRQPAPGPGHRFCKR